MNGIWKSKSLLSMLRAPLVATLAIVFLSVPGCDEAGNTGDQLPPDDYAGSAESGVDMTGFDVSRNVGADGAAISLPDGMTVTIPVAGVPEYIDIGLSADVPAPELATDATPVSGWYEMGASTVDVTTSNDRPFVFQIPVDAPAEAVGHPGLQLWLVLDDETQIPVHGTWDQSTGIFQAVLLALPPRFKFAVVFNENIVRLDGGYELWDAIQASPRSFAPRAWSTAEWTIDYDGNAVTAEQARKVLNAARTAAAVYSQAGFAEPILVRDDQGDGMRWHVHLVNGGSHFTGDSKTTEKNVVQLVGDLYVSTACIDIADGIGKGVLAQTAHELFHAIFWGYNVPFEPFTYQSGGRTYGYRSNSGLNEGIATAVGNFIDVGAAVPRSFTAPSKLTLPLGIFSQDDLGLAYRNQDFFVFLLRVGSLSNIRQFVESLATTDAAAIKGASRYGIVRAYADAVEKGGMGLTGGTGTVSLNEILSEYMANRAYVRSAEGWIWQSEPNGGTAGAQYVIDRTLFGRDIIHLDVDDCVVETRNATCTFEFVTNPVAGTLVEANMDSLGRDFGFVPTLVDASASSLSGGLYYWLFGEYEDQGSSDWFARGNNSSNAEMSFAEGQFSDLLMIVTSGTALGKVQVTMNFQGEQPSLGPECQELAACCPNLPTQAVINDCNKYVAAADENNCSIAGISLLRLCR